MAGENVRFVALVDCGVVDLKQSLASFFDIFDSLNFAQMPTSQHVAIFVPMTTDGQTDCFTPCACAWGKKFVAQCHNSVYPPSILYILNAVYSVLRGELKRKM